MRLIKDYKKLLGLALSFIMILSFATSSFAAEQDIVQDDRDYLIVNGTDIVYVGEDYENPDTNEYIHWSKDEKGLIKSFDFRIRYSITSSSFKTTSTKARVTANAHVENLSGQTISGYSGHLYTVSLVGLYSRNLQFSVGSSQSGTVTGLQSGGSYQVRITNNDKLKEDTHYLVGSGSVSSI